MHTRGFWKLDEISDERLVGGLRQLVNADARNEARIVAHLAELDARRISLKQAQSLFEYCQKRLGFSQNQAYYRIAAARVGARFPIVFELLEQRKIHLVNLAPLSKLLTQENHRELLAQAALLSKRELLEYLARRYPRSEGENSIRRLPPRPGAFSAGPTASLEPLSSTTYRLQLNASQALVQKLELANDLMSHSNPSGDLAVVVERALELLIDRLKSRRFGLAKRPRSRKSPRSTQPRQPEGDGVRAPQGQKQETPQDLAETRSEPSAVGSPQPNLHRSNRSPATRPHIVHETRRAVVERDGVRCSFVDHEGHRCSARRFLEFDHDRAFGHGGDNSPGNLRLFCRAHNQLAAELVFGKRRIEAAIRARRAPNQP